MDVLDLPKLAAAAMVGAAAVTALPRLAHPSDVVTLKLEWIGSDRTKAVESLVLRTVIGETTESRQGTRTVEATPMLSPAGDGTVMVKLKVVDAATTGDESLNTSVRTAPGETVVVMGTSKKDGRSVSERMLFLTATPQ